MMSQKPFFGISGFGYHVSVQWSMMKNIHSPNLVEIGSWGPEIWPHELKSVQIGLVHNCLEPGQAFY